MNSEPKSALFAADGHPDENQLLLAFERELSAEEVAQVEQHLGTCWSCRARSEEMQRGILAFVEYREKKYLPSLSTPPHDFENFRGSLRVTAGASPRAGLLVRIWRWLSALFVLPGQVKWVSVVAAGMTLLIVWVQVIDPPVISANEFLSRAIAAEKPPATRETGKRVYVARQKIQIRSGDRDFVKDFEWTVGGPVQQPAWDLQSDPLQWNVPLTAVAFAKWRDTLKKKKDKVKRSTGFLTLDTVAEHSPIREAWIVVRADDFHLVEQHLRFANDRRVDFREIAFQVIGEAQESKPSAQTESRTVTTIEPPMAPPQPSQSDLDEMEVQVRYTLFSHRWDLEEDLTIGRDRGRVTLSGTAGSAEREKDMRAAFSTFSNFQLSIGAPSPLSASASAPNRGLPSKGATASSIPLLREVLDDSFSTRDERLAFVDRCLSASDAELAHAWALKRLADRYSELERQRLKPESRDKLREMARVHLQAISQANVELNPLFDLLPSSTASSASAPTSWRTGVLSLFSQIQQQDDLVTSLVVGTQTGAQDLASASARLRSIHQNIPFLLSGVAKFAGN